jgi:tetratricopeptide (TPR) repeat protein
MDLSSLSGISPAALFAISTAAVALLFFFFLTFYRREQKLADYQAKFSLEGKSPRWIEKKAQELIRVEAFRLAGDLHAHLGKWTEAAELYRKGGNFFRAAESSLAAGETAAAAKAYRESKDFERAAALFLENNNFAEAASALLEAGESLRAAQALDRGGLAERAAEIYLEQGLYRQAAEMYKKKGVWGRAGDALWRCFGQEQARLPEEVSARDSMPLRHLARQAGDMFREAGRLEEAVEAYAAGWWALERAQTLEQAGKILEAAEAFLEAGYPLRAANAFETAGQTARAALLRAERLLAAGSEREAAPFLETAGEFGRAAEIYRRLEQWLEAARCYREGGAFVEAAAMFERAGEFEPAAENQELAGNPRVAADLYARAGNLGAQAQALEKAGEHIPAGANYFERGLFDQAIAVLQKVEAGAPDYAVAALMLGQIFREKGMLELAHGYFKRSLRDGELSRSNLENFYQLAVCSERMANQEEASAIFEKILALDFHFKDVADRLNAIKSSRTVIETTPSRPGMEATLAGERPAPPPPAPDGSGRHYSRGDEIGRGGMGIVYKARDNKLERTVAIKMLPSNLKDHPLAVKNFLREARSAAQLNHPNIVTIYELGEEDGNYFIAMEYLEGKTVKELLNQDGKLPVKAVLMIAGQVCKALEYAHDRRIVHRDIKSSNIMWTPDKQVKLMDFGLAKMIEEVKGYQTIASGTPYYMSPEQVLGRDIDHRTDLYSLGVTLFEMATGRLPFHYGDAAYHHVHTPPPEAIGVNPALPEALSHIILKCMQKKPEDRFANARELFNALRQAGVS